MGEGEGDREVSGDTSAESVMKKPAMFKRPAAAPEVVSDAEDKCVKSKQSEKNKEEKTKEPKQDPGEGRRS